MSRALNPPIGIEAPRRGGIPMVLLALVIGAAVVLFFSTLSLTAAAAILGVAVAIVLARVVPYVARYQEWNLLAVVLVELIASVHFFSGAAASVAHYALIALFTIPLMMKTWRSGLLRRGAFFLFIVYLAWGAVTIGYSEAPMYSFARLCMTTMIVGGLIALASEVQNAGDLRRLMGIFLIGCGIIVGLCLVAAVVLPRDITWLVDDEAGPDASGIARFCGILDNPNEVGTLMLSTMTAALIYWSEARGGYRVLVALTMIASLLIAGLADSRTSFVAVAIGLTCYSLWKYKGRAVAVITVLIGAAFFGSAMIFHGVPSYLSRGDVGTLTGRTAVWSFAIKSIENNPLLGYGYQAGGAILQSRYFPIWWGPWDQGPKSSLHNLYLTHAVEVGIPAALLWLYAVLRPWIFIVRRKSDPWGLKPVVFLVILPILILGFAESTVADGTYSVGILFMLLWAVGERFRLFALEEDRKERRDAIASMPPAMAALLGALTIFFIVASPRIASARDYYVDSIHGSDANNGMSQSSAIATIHRALGLRAQPGDRILLARGALWREQMAIDPPWIAGADRPITIASYGDGPLPIISGSNPVSPGEWTPACGGSCYQASIAQPVKRIFVDGDGFSSDRMRSTPEQLTAGTWAYTGGRFYVRLADDSNPAQHKIEVTLREWGVRCWRCRGVVVEDIEVENTWEDGINFDGPVDPSRATQDIVVRGCVIHDIGRGDYDENGVQAGSTYAWSVLVENNRIYRIGLARTYGMSTRGGGGIGVLFNRCENCIARANDIDAAGHIGIAVQITEEAKAGGPEPSGEVVNNRIYNCPGIPGQDRCDAIYTRRAHDVLIANNTIRNIQSPVAGGGNAVHVGIASTNIRIVANDARQVAGGVYIDGDDSNAIQVKGNTFVDAQLFFVRVPQEPISTTFADNTYSNSSRASPFAVVSTMGTQWMNLTQWQSLGRN